MKYLLLGICAGVMLTACNSDSDQHAPTTDIEAASVITVEMLEFEPSSGHLAFALKDEQGVTISNAQHYRVYYFGYPKEKVVSGRAKAWRKWHVSYPFHCDANECDTPLIAVDGHYQLTPKSLDWAADVRAGAVERYQVAVQVLSSTTHSEVVMFKPPA
ncbi:hypothetical protein [Shewanella sp. NIFS-20-20]|uniref:hypothetical protein n=1 Tax=Shewanella sp. NIFS-20-20 TaxID=2853806 RepID=UPI001C48F35C|nr:hypothetical protein [Shewanella sp. NIFS-20-20]MBV7317559.1 hypothetical protein [Shewanella sp. NIFS-20-20]